MPLRRQKLFLDAIHSIRKLSSPGDQFHSSFRCGSILGHHCLYSKHTTAFPAEGLRKLFGLPNNIQPVQKAFRDIAQAARASRPSHRLLCDKPKTGWEKFRPKQNPNSKDSPHSRGSKGQKSSRESPTGTGGPKPDRNGDRWNFGQDFSKFFSNPGVELALLAAIGLLYLRLDSSSETQQISFHDFKYRLLEEGLVDRIEIANKSIARIYVFERQNHGRKPTGYESEDSQVETYSSRPTSSLRSIHKYNLVIGSVDTFERKLEDAQKEIGIPERDYLSVIYKADVNWTSELLRAAPLVLLMLSLWSLRSQIGPTMASAANTSVGSERNIFNMGKASINRVNKKVLFKDVAGCDEAKAEIIEFVDFLKSPEKYKSLGARIPKGALLVGPPGTGKTLLAKATAGEANVPFLSVSGSDFMEVFVGIGASRVRDLFSKARRNSPSIIFIDEIDAIGRARGRSVGGGNDERESTLNQLLVEMDGFQTDTNVVVLAGTNRADVLDPALIRPDFPGRFDRQISVDRPDVKGREAIFKVHLNSLKLEKGEKNMDIYASRLAALTPGFVGADIANVCNEAALHAARRNSKNVLEQDFEAAIDRVIGGLEKKHKVISPEERKTVAYHEAGHAVVGWFLEHTEPLLKVTIVPRGAAALGFAQYLPNENLLQTREQMYDMICMALGGRAAEDVLIGKISTGAQNDLERVTKAAYNKVAVFGFNKKIGMLSFPSESSRVEMFKPYSEETAKIIDVEVRELVDTAYNRTIDIVKEKKDVIEKLANELLAKETLQLEDLEAVLGKRPFQAHRLSNIEKSRMTSFDKPKEETPVLQPKAGVVSNSSTNLAPAD